MDFRLQIVFYRGEMIDSIRFIKKNTLMILQCVLLTSGAIKGTSICAVSSD